MKHPITTTTNYMKHLNLLSTLALLLYIGMSSVAQPCNDFTSTVMAYDTCDPLNQCWANNNTGNSSYAVAIPGLTFGGAGTPDHYVFDANTPGIFTEYTDGTAKLTGTIHNINDPTKIFYIDVGLENRKNWLTWYTGGTVTDHYRDDNGLAGFPNNYYENWSYYEIDGGTFTGAGSISGELIIDHNFGGLGIHHSFQVGTAANNQTTDFGMSADFQYSGMIDGQVIFGTDGVFSMNAGCTAETCNGFAQVLANGGTPPYSYAWSVTEDAYAGALGLCCGDYTVTVQDSQGCTSTDTFTIGSCDVEGIVVATTGDCEQQCVAKYAGDEPHAIWLKDIPGTNKYVFEDGAGKFIQYPDGSSKLTGRIMNTTDADKQWDVDFYFKDKKTWTEWQASVSTATYLGDPVLVDTHFKNWFYHTMDSVGLKSQLTGVPGTFFEGAILYMEHDSENGKYAFQIGKGGNAMNANNGIGGWFKFWGNDGDGNPFFEDKARGDVNVDFCMDCQGAADVLVSVTTAGFTYELSPSGATIVQNGDLLTITNLCSGSYQLLITDDNGCTGTTDINIASLPSPIVEIEDVTICADELPVSLDAGSGFATYDWSTGETTQSISVNMAGNYSVTVTSAGAGSSGGGVGCAASDEATVTVYDSPTTNLGPDENVCATDLPITLDAGSGAESYIWSGGQITQTITVPTGGLYSVTVTSANGCTATDSKNVFIVENPIVDLGEDINVCANEAPVTLDAGDGFSAYVWSTGATTQTIEVDIAGIYSVTVTEGGAGSSAACMGHDAVMVDIYTSPSIDLPSEIAVCADEAPVILDAGVGFEIYQWSNGDMTNTTTIEESGIYSVVVTDQNGCTNSKEIMVTIHPNPDVDLGQDMTVCTNELPNILDAGGGMATYEWSNGGSSQTISVNEAGTYSVTVTDQNGCTGSDSQTISIEESPSIDLGEDVNICVETVPFIVDAGDGFAAYQWSTGAVVQTINVTVTGTYTVIVTAQNGCTATDSKFVTVSDEIELDLGEDVQVCANEVPLILNAGSGYATYQWSNGANTQSISVETSGTYSVVVTDQSGCSATDSKQVTVYENPTVDLGGSTAICANELPFNIDAGSGYASYLWSNGEVTQSIQATSAGNYHVTVTDENGCTATDTKPLTVYLNPNYDLGEDMIVCANELPVNIDAGSGYASYLWSNGETSQTIAVETAGNYSVTITDENGCTASDSKNLTIFQNATIDLGGNMSVCVNELPVAINAGGGFVSYIWSNDATTQSISVLEGGVYTVIATDENGCTATDTKVLIVHPEPAIDLGNTLTVCADGLPLTINAGSGFENYNWSNGAATPSIEIFEAGIYSVTVTDENGCTAVDTKEVIIGEELNVDLGEDMSVCAENLPFVINAGSGFATYEWSNGAQTQSISVLEAGIYSVTVTDGGACMASDTKTLSIHPSPEVNLGDDITVCTDELPVTLEAPSGYTSYTWSNGETSQSIQVSNGGTYTLTVTDENGCAASDSKSVIVLANPVVNLGDDAAVCTDQLPVTLHAGGGFVAYAWSNGADTPSITVEESGIYSVVVTGGNGCTGSDSKEIIIYQNPSINLGDDIAVCTDQLPVNISAGGGFAIYEWSNGESSASINILEGGMYSVVVTDENGCTASDEVLVTVYELPDLELGDDFEICPQNFPITLDAGSGFEDYSWSNESITQTISINTGGTYSVTVTDENGCMNSDSIHIIETNAGEDCSCPSLMDAMPSHTDICTGESVDLNVTVNNPDGGVLTWYDEAGNAIADPTNVVLIAENCQGISYDFYAVYVSAFDACEDVVSETISVMVFPQVAASIEGDMCVVEVVPSCSNYIVSWEDDMGNSGDGAIYTAAANTNGTVTFNVYNYEAMNLGLDCGTLEIEGTYNCDCESNSTGAAFFQPACSGTTINVHEIWENILVPVIITDEAGNEVINPENVSLTSVGCDTETAEYTATYTTFDDDGCPIVHTDVLTIVIYPAITGELTVLEDDGDCTVSLSQVCTSFEASWSDDAGNTGVGFDYTATAGQSGIVTFVVTNFNGETGLPCVSNEFVQTFNCCASPVLVVDATAEACNGDILNLNEIVGVPADLTPLWLDTDGNEVLNPENEMVAASDCNGTVKVYVTEYEQMDVVTGCPQVIQVALGVNTYPDIVASPEFDNENCTITITPSCPNYTVSYIDDLGSVGNGNVYTATPGASGQVTFTVSNPEVTNPDFDCQMADFTYNYSCGCPVLSNPTASAMAVCDGDAISLHIDVVAMGEDVGGELSWYDSDNNFVTNPANVVLEGEGCEGTVHEFYAIYVPGNETCATVTSATIQVTAYPAVSATAETSSGGCTIVVSQECADYTATWADDLGNSGSGFAYHADNNEMGTVVFTISHPAIADLDCGTYTASQAFDCMCPTDVLSAAFMHVTCSLVPTNLNEVWGTGASDLTWTDVFGNVITNPANIIFPANGCTPQTTELSTTYTTADGDGCEVTHNDIVNIVVYPFIMGGETAVSEDACMVTMNVDCDNYEATWTDDLGNSGSGFEYIAANGTMGVVTFVVTHEDVSGVNLDCVSSSFTSPFDCMDTMECPELSNPTVSEDAVCSGEAISLAATLTNDDGGILNWFNETGDIISNPANVILNTDACEGEIFTFYASYVPTNIDCETVQSETVSVTVYAAITTTLDMAADGCSVVASQNCSNYSAAWSDDTGNTGTGFTYIATPGTTGTVTFTITNDNLVGAAFSCATAEFSSLYSCTSCPILGNPEVSEAIVCSGETVGLNVAIINGDGGTVSWFDMDDNLVSNPTEILLITDECEGQLFTYYAVYTPTDPDCPPITTDIVEVKAYPEISATLMVSEDDCTVTASMVCSEFEASWADNLGNVGTGLVYQAGVETMGVVTFTFDIPGLSGLSCSDLQLTANFNCTTCPNENTASQSFTNVACSLDPVNLNNVWGAGASDLVWLDIFGNAITNPANIIFPANGCDNNTTNLIANYPSLDADGCTVENMDTVTLITVPNTITGEITVSSNECTVTVSQDCANYAATWTDSFGNTGNGFVYNANAGENGSVTFTLTNNNDMGLDCASLELSANFDCVCPPDNTASQSFTNVACSLDPVNLNNVWGAGASDLVWLDIFGNAITNPANIIFPANGCDNNTTNLIANYPSLDADGCTVENMDTVTLITVPNTITGEITVSSNECTVTVSQDCANYAATWTDSFGNTGSGFVYNANAGENGSVTFTLTNNNDMGLGCASLELSANFDCVCPPDNTASQSFTNVACSLDPVNLNNVWGAGASDLVWLDIFGNAITNPANIIFPANGCDNNTTNLIANYPSLDDDGCTVENMDTVTLITVPNTITGEITVSSNECTVTVSQDCANYAATWTDSFGNTGNGFVYNANAGENGSVTFTLTNSNDMGLGCASLELSANFDCVCPPDNTASQSFTNVACSLDPVNLNNVWGAGASDLVWLDIFGNAITNPANIIFPATGCNNVTNLIANYPSIDASGCPVENMDTVTLVTVPLEVTGTISASSDGCTVTLSQDCPTYTATWVDDLGNSGSGFVYNAAEMSGSVTFTVVNSSVVGLGLDCGTAEFSTNYACMPPDGGTISGFVWNDFNGNGIQNPGEVGLQGVLVVLVNSDTGVNIDMVMTDINGNYEFTNLPDGNYNVVVGTPPGFIGTEQGAGSDPALDSDISPGVGASMPAFVSNNTIDVDAGFYQIVSLGDLVWIDSNQNGIQDGLEVGLAGVTVNLLDELGNLIASQVTGTDGSYLFIGLPPGTYTIEVEVNTAFPYTTLTTPGTYTATLISGDTFLTADFGFEDADFPTIDAIDDFVTTDEDVMITIDVLANDLPVGGMFTITNVTNVTPGASVTMSPDGMLVTYTPPPGFAGVDSFLYTITDPVSGLMDVAWVFVTINAGPCMPQATMTQHCTAPLTALTICLDSGCDNTTITEANATTAPFVVILNDTCIRYTPIAGFLGIDTVSLVICDDQVPANCVNSTALVSVPCADAPIAIDDVVNILENESVTINVTENDIFATTVTVSITDFPANGTVTIIGNNVIYTPNPGFTGTDNFTYEITDPFGQTDQALVTIVVTPIPCELTFMDCVLPFTALEICPEFCDVPGLDFEVIGVMTSDGGSATPTGVDGCYSYISLPDFMGVETITFLACDSGGGPCTTTSYVVTVAGECDLQANDDLDTTVINTPVSIAVLLNDFDPQGDPFSITNIVENPMNGMVMISGDMIIYMPNAGFVGIDSFVYQICDTTGACDEATVFVEVIDGSPCNNMLQVCTDMMMTTEICVEFCNVPDAVLTDVQETLPASITFMNDTCVSYTALPGVNGIDTLLFIGCNDAGICDTVFVEVIVGCIAPTANDDIGTVMLGNSLNINVLDNDEQLCGFELATTLIDAGTLGTAVLDTNGDLVYTPNVDAGGSTDVLTYVACNNCTVPLCDTAIVTITIPEPENPVIAEPDIAYTLEDTPVIIEVLNNDIGTNLMVTSITIPENGTAEIQADGTIIYTPNTGFVGEDYFFYVVCNDEGTCDTTIVAVNVLPIDDPNLPPIANNDMAETSVGTPITIPVLINDTDPEGDDLVITTVSVPTNGMVTITDGGTTVTYTPDPGFVGTDSFFYVVCDMQTPPLCDTAYVGVSIGIPFPNQPPVAVPDTDSTFVDIPVEICILDNDSDPNPDDTNETLTIIIGSDPAHGTVVVDPISQKATYTPEPGFSGIDFFTYVICDDGLPFAPSLCDTTWVEITVIDSEDNLPPIAVNDEVTTFENTLVVIDILANDDPTDNLLEDHTVTILTLPTNGTAVLNADNMVEYLPNPDFIGADSFTYVLCDPFALCDTATVFIFVGPAIDAEPDIAFTSEDTPVLIDVITNDFGAGITVCNIVSQPDSGMVLIVGGMIEYTPNPGFTGMDYFFYEICDTLGNTDQTIVGVLVLQEGIINFPPLANNDVATTPVNTPITIPVLANDSDPNGDPIVITDVIAPVDGTVMFTDSTITYTPDLDFTGVVCFDYIVCDDGMPMLCDTATVCITVGDGALSNNPPLAIDDTTMTLQGLPVIIEVKANDSDPDGDNLIVTLATAPAYGSAVADPTGCFFTYTPSPGADSVDYFIYLLCDDGDPVLCDTAYVLVNIFDVPLMGDLDSICVATDEDTPITICVEEFIDPLPYPIDSIMFFTTPANGFVFTNTDPPSDSCFTYLPAMDYVGTDTFYIGICNTTIGMCDSVLVKIMVDPVNDPPVAVNDTVMLIEMDTIITVLDNDFDPDGDPISIVQILDPPVFGTADWISPDSILYTFSGEPGITKDSFSYVIQDTTSLMDTAWVCIVIEIVTEASVIANDDIDTTMVNTPIDIMVLANDTTIGIFMPMDTTLTIITDPENGMAIVNTDYTVTYTPDDNFFGTDTFVYEWCVNDFCDTATVTIIVPPDCEGLRIPDGFTPNGDGLNEAFTITALDECFPENELLIFNRWGDIVFERTNYSNMEPWTGTWEKNDENLPDGTYFYILRIGTQGMSMNGAVEIHR